MGNFEKLVVMTVLFLCLLVLAVSFRRGGEDEVDGRGPLGDVATLSEVPEPASSAGEGLLDASVGVADPAPGPAATRGAPTPGAAADPLSAGADLAPTPAPLPGTILLSMEGLTEPTLPGSGFLLYSPVEGDRWTGIAQRFYGDPARARLLLQANEELAGGLPIPGQPIAIPVRDTTQRPERASAEPVLRASDLAAARIPAPATATDAGAAAAPASSPGAAAARPGTYVVKNGDTLSEIAEALYGKSARWRDIYQANSTKLASPDVLVVGMELVIPTP